MSNWRDSSCHEGTPAFNAWNFPKLSATKTNDPTNGFNSNHKAKNPWNQIFMQHDIENGQTNDDYKISSSLKTIWNDVSDGSSTNSSGHNVDISTRNDYARGGRNNYAQSVQRASNVKTLVGNDIPLRAFGLASDNAAVMTNNSNSLRGRAITSRNGSYNSNVFMENGNRNQQTYSTSMTLQQENEQFMQKVHLIVQNGFLDAKILKETISLETFNLVEMLIYYVMEYSRTRKYNTYDNNPVLNDEIRIIFHKINLIQKEIEKCQTKLVQHEQVQRAIMQSYSGAKKPQNFTGHSFHNRTGVPMANASGNGKCNQFVNSSNPNLPNRCVYPSKSENYEWPNQRFGQRQCDQYAQHKNVGSTGKFTFLAKAKNIDKSSFYYEHNHIISRRDGYFSTS